MDFVFHETFGFLVNRCGILMREELQSRFAAAGIEITAEEWALLGALKSRGRLPVSALAKATLKDRTTVTRFVDRLIEKGLVVRSESLSDRRVVNLELSKAGGVLTTRAMAVVKKFLGEIHAQVSAREMDAARSVLAQVCAMLEGRV